MNPQTANHFDGTPKTAAEKLAAVQANIFALLLEEYGRLRQLSEAQFYRRTLYENLLEEYGRQAKAVAAADIVDAARHADAFGELLREYARAYETYTVQQETRADEFNIADVLEVTHKETRHSMVLAWLLDHDIRRLGTHAQRNLGFRSFLEELHLPATYAEAPYRVRREVAGDESIVDIEISSRGRFLIHIENKIRAKEGLDQTDREWGDLLRRARSLDIHATGPDPSVHALYLTPDGDQPLCPFFRPITWRAIARVLDEFAEQAAAPDVKLFARHYANGIRRFIVISRRTEDETATE